jgi:hypothetical protein
MNLAKEVEKLREQLAALQAKDKDFLLFYRGNDPEKELQWHIDAGIYDPAKQEPFIVMAWGPRPRSDPKTYRKGWTSELPAAPKRNQAYEIAQTSPSPRFAGTYLDEPVPEPIPERRYRIRYPDTGIV